MKACSGKFTPIQQFLYFDSLESLPEGDVDPADLQPVSLFFYLSRKWTMLIKFQNGSRYDAQVAVFGRKFQQKIGNSRYFIVCNTYINIIFKLTLLRSGPVPSAASI